jgi:hypothetical protein
MSSLYVCYHLCAWSDDNKIPRRGFPVYFAGATKEKERAVGLATVGSLGERAMGLHRPSNWSGEIRVTSQRKRFEL